MQSKSRRLFRIAHGKLWKFFGGVKPEGMKDAAGDAIEQLRIPSLITLPVDRYMGKDGQLLVNTGDYVKRGQPLTVPGGGRLVPLHASTSGTVLSIGDQVLPHPSGCTGRCVTIKTDGLDAAVDPKPLKDWAEAAPGQILSHIREMGVEGMGGALYQTAAKLTSALDGPLKGCKVFIVNGCECEPGLTCDDRLMRERAGQIADGIRIIQRILNPKITIVAIEDDKQEAIKAMTEATSGIAFVRALPVRYPSGEARPLIRIVTGIEVPYGVHTSECGVVVDNVGTVYAVKRAVIDGEPVTSRIVTVTGSSMKRHGNAEVRLGTSVRFILNSFHLHPEYRQRVIMGGPMMGFTLPSIDVPVTKGTGCIMAPGAGEVPLSDPPMNCIRCGRCARACPSRLVPYQMYAFSKAGDHAHAAKCGIGDCTLCGSCAFACPSRIPLSLQFRREKAVQQILRQTEQRNTRAREAAAEHEKREAERKARIAAKRAAAMARIKAGGKAAPSRAPGEGAQASADALDLEQRRQAALKARAARKARLEAAAETTQEALESKEAQARQQEAANAAARADQAQAREADGSSSPSSPSLPYSLRRGGRLKVAQKVELWQAPSEHAPDLSLVGQVPDENAPAPAGRVITRKLPVETFEEPRPEEHPLPQNLKKLRSRR
ncbi:MAG: electron transport complex subunit RsxC [Succinivibrio sp.]